MLSKHIEDKHLRIAILSSESLEHTKQTTYHILKNDSHSDDSFENVSIEKEKISQGRGCNPACMVKSNINV